MLQATPEKLVFGCNMLLGINFQPDYKEMWLRKKTIGNNNNKHENAKQVECDYKIGHYAYILRDRNYSKLEEEKLGPFRITQMHTNGSVRIQQGIVHERTKIRRLTPHFGDTPT